MGTAEIVGLVVALAGVNLVGVLGAGWKLSGRLTRMETILKPLEGMSDRVTRVETQLATLTTAPNQLATLEANMKHHDTLFEAIFERPDGPTH